MKLSSLCSLNEHKNFFFFLKNTEIFEPKPTHCQVASINDNVTDRKPLTTTFSLVQEILAPNLTYQLKLIFTQKEWKSVQAATSVYLLSFEVIGVNVTFLKMIYKLEFLRSLYFNKISKWNISPFSLQTKMHRPNKALFIVYFCSVIHMQFIFHSSDDVRLYVTSFKCPNTVL